MTFLDEIVDVIQGHPLQVQPVLVGLCKSEQSPFLDAQCKQVCKEGAIICMPTVSFCWISLQLYAPQLMQILKTRGDKTTAAWEPGECLLRTDPRFDPPIDCHRLLPLTVLIEYGCECQFSATSSSPEPYGNSDFLSPSGPIQSHVCSSLQVGPASTTSLTSIFPRCWLHDRSLFKVVSCSLFCCESLVNKLLPIWLSQNLISILTRMTKM